MVKPIRARFSAGKIEPLEQVDLIEGEEVLVTITELPGSPPADLAESLRATAGAWRDLVDSEALKRNIAEDREVSRPATLGL